MLQSMLTAHQTYARQLIQFGVECIMGIPLKLTIHCCESIHASKRFSVIQLDVNVKRCEESGAAAVR